MSSKSAASSVAAEPFVFAPPKGGGAAAWQTPQHASPCAESSADPQGYEKGLSDGELRARTAFQKDLAAVRSGVSQALREFDAQRTKYFESVEGEVVQLALSIARKILHREAQIDPLLLTGIVRVALDSLNEGTHVRLRANPQEVPFWRDYFNQATDIVPSPETIGEPSLEPGCCLLETDLGTTRISMETQLKEIEQGFLDLLERRPRVRE